MFNCGRYQVSLHNFGFFRLDGGAMFGSVPKNLWAKRLAADPENCIQLATRSLLIRDTQSSRVILVDVGMGEKWTEKQRTIFGIQNHSFQQVGIDPTEVTDVILTHLHFDHAGGISRYAGDGKLELVYPKARIFLQRANLKNAHNPSPKERASYLAENFGPVEQGQVTLVDGDSEVLPNIWVHQVDGHSRGQQWIEVRGGAQSLFYPTDLIPTSHHLPVPYHMGYDNCAETVMQEKQAFNQRAVEEKAIVIFQHDPELAAATIKKDERGHFSVEQAAV